MRVDRMTLLRNQIHFYLSNSAWFSPFGLFLLPSSGNISVLSLAIGDEIEIAGSIRSFSFLCVPSS